MTERVRIKLLHGRSLEVEAHVFGEWAAHPGIDEGDVLRLDWWVVTHVPNGRRIRSPGEMTEDEAIRLSRALAERDVRLPVWANDFDDVAPCALDPKYKQVAQAVRSAVFDTLGRCTEVE